MYQTQITVAGLKINVEHHFESFKSFAEDFVIKPQGSDFSVSVSNEDIENELILLEKQREQDDQAVGRVTDAMLEETAIYRKIADNLAKYNAIVFHGSAVAVDGRAVVFSAASGTGKTTHTKLWLKNIKGSFVVDGDKPILRVLDSGVYVCGTPWNGKERMGTNKNIPLTAICRIIRSGENHIEKVTVTAFLPHLLEQTHCPRKAGAMSNNLCVIKKIAEKVSFYNLYCNMEDSAALLSFGEMMP